MITFEKAKGEAHVRNINELCDIIRETAYAIHCCHGHGHLEKVYENALAHRLRKAGLHAAQILGYLRSDRREHGLLINFGSYKFQIRKFAKALDSRVF
jgi:hypothetical protein